MERTLRYQDISMLHEGDYFLNGKLYDAKGSEVKVEGLSRHRCQRKVPPLAACRQGVGAVPFKTARSQRLDEWRFIVKSISSRVRVEVRSTHGAKQPSRR